MTEVEMAKWKCGLCDEEHAELPMDIAYARPEHYFEIPLADRERRSWFNQETNADVCVIDGKTFLIRAFLPIPVEGGKEFRHGVWVLVDETSFRKYATFEGDGSDEPPFDCQVSSEIPGYPSTFLLNAEVQLGTPTQRPAVRVNRCSHLLSTEQREGISMARVHELVRAALPEKFKAGPYEY
jgi:hypothetical protein